MCPICWATALAAWSGLLIVGAMSVAGADGPSRFLAATLSLVVLVFYLGDWAIPWWIFAIVMTALFVRITYLLLLHREKLVVTKIWNRARRIAANRCPRNYSTSKPAINGDQ